MNCLLPSQVSLFLLAFAVLPGPALLSALFPAAVTTAGETAPGTSTRATLPGGGMVVVAEGRGEAGNAGSYSVRLYSGKNQDRPLDDFLGGVVRPREGSIESVVLDDLDSNAVPEIIVTIRGAGKGSPLSADVFTVSGGAVLLVDSLTGLPANARPADEFKERIQHERLTVPLNNSSSCRKITENQTKNLPSKYTHLSLNQIKKVCIDYGEPDLWAKIEQDPPPKPFQSDGCSLWLGSWQGRDLYPACFLHDLKYWAGYPEEDVERLIADAELMIDVACLLGSTAMAETMFHGARLGGAEMYRRSFSWGFGRE